MPVPARQAKSFSLHAALCSQQHNTMQPLQEFFNNIASGYGLNIPTELLKQGLRGAVLFTLLGSCMDTQ